MGSEESSRRVEAGELVGHEPHELMQLVLDGRLGAAVSRLQSSLHAVYLAFVPTPPGHKMPRHLPIHTLCFRGACFGGTSTICRCAASSLTPTWTSAR